MSTRLIPERTVDSLVAHELLSAFPTGLIWSPTNTRHAADHWFYMSSSVAPLVLECKGVVSRGLDPDNDWTVPLDLHQLDRYCSHSASTVHYLFVSKPEKRPWIRKCDSDADARGRCLACRGLAIDRRALAGLRANVKGAQLHVRIQPWVSHWSWLISAGDLRAHIRTGRRPGQSTLTLDGSDGAMAAMPGSRRFCHVFGRGPVMLPTTASGVADLLHLQPVRLDVLMELSNDPESTPPWVFRLPEAAGSRSPRQAARP